jgi:hypothetical protein
MADELAPKLAVITVNVNSGKIVSVEAVNGAAKTDPVPQQEIENIYNGPAELRHIGTAMFTHSSPGCLYWWQGRWIKVC